MREAFRHGSLFFCLWKYHTLVYGILLQHIICWRFSHTVSLPALRPSPLDPRPSPFSLLPSPFDLRPLTLALRPSKIPPSPLEGAGFGTKQVRNYRRIIYFFFFILLMILLLVSCLLIVNKTLDISEHIYDYGFYYFLGIILLMIVFYVGATLN